MIGRQVSHFYVIRALGSGGMGTVYEAQDTRLPRSVAIKFLNAALSRNHEAIRRFKREARLASSLNHPNICTVLDVDEGHGQSFIAMELLQGNSLKERLAAGPMATDEILDVGVQAADALAAAHERGIMHRDITPGNIFVTRDGLVKLLDFGLAKQFMSIDDDEYVTETLTEPGNVAGTVHYMAPEQFSDGASVDHRCDLFSLGAVLYQMATGSRPFPAKSKAEVISLIVDHPHVPLRQLAPQHSVQLEQAIDRLLAKRADDRYETAAALRADLEAMKRTRQSASRSLVTEAPAAGSSIAVLPFEILGACTTEIEQFRDGLVEEIGSRLSDMRDVRVAPRTSTRLVTGLPLREIGRQLDVTLAIEGSIQQAGQRVKVVANLVDAASERAMAPAVRIARDLTDVFDVQDAAAHEIVSRLAPAFTRVPGRLQTNDAEAFQAFKRGQQHWKNPFSSGWRAAIECFQHAVERDERFAAAHVALGAAYNFLGFYSLLKPNLAFSIARRSLERAIEIDATLALAHAELGLASFGGEWDWDTAEHEFRRALQLDPACAVAHAYYSWLLMLLGRQDAGFTEVRAAQAQTPPSRFIAAASAQALYLAHRYEDAVALCDEILRAHADYPYALHLRAQCYREVSKDEEARADLERAAALTNRAPFYLGILGHWYGHKRMRREVLDLLEELDRKSNEMYVPPQCYVYIYAGLGEREKALQFQERAYEDGASPLGYLTPFIRDLYALDPHQKRRLEQMRLVL